MGYLGYEYRKGGVLLNHAGHLCSLDGYLLTVLQQTGPRTRGELETLTGVPRTTLYDTLIKLILQNKVERVATSERKQGRPNVYFKAVFDPNTCIHYYREEKICWKDTHGKNCDEPCPHYEDVSGER